MNHEQLRVVDLVTKRRKPSVSSGGGVEGPFIPLVYIPGILDRLQAVGEHCRFHTSLPAKLRELAIMITGRYVSAQIEFHVHAMEAREFGLPEASVAAIAANERPQNMAPDEELIYEFCTAYHTQGEVSDAVFQQTADAFGLTGIVELMTTCGYYATLGLSMNVTYPPIPEFLKAGYKPPFPVPND
jgi:4-carboxymuconolactone decarboxylase